MPKIGTEAPDFELPNQDKQLIRLSDYRGRKLVLFAFPKANTSGCNLQACSFRDEFARFETVNAQVLGISSDSSEELKLWKAQKHLQFDLLSDPNHKVLDAWGAWGYKLFLLKLPILATRSYWIIDEKGIVIDKQIDVDPEESVEKALFVLEKAVLNS